MLLITICLFLRGDEVVKIKIEDFNPEISIVDENGIVISLAVTVFGKSDRNPVTLVMWANDEIPAFCPVKHLLVYLFLSKIKKGYLFLGDCDGHIGNYHVIINI